MNTPIRARAADLFGSLSHPTRLRIVELLREGEKTVNDIAGTLGLTQSGTSQHLAVLSRAGILVAEPRGSSRYYRVRGWRVGRILELIEEFCTIHGLYGDEAETEPDAEGRVLQSSPTEDPEITG